MDWLADRGFGKSGSTADLDVQYVPRNIDPAKLTAKEQDVLHELIAKAQPNGFEKIYRQPSRERIAELLKFVQQEMSEQKQAESAPD